MKHFLYKTTNLKNDRYYIGVHSTRNMDDGYLGSGKILQQAIQEYGKENFKREVISYHDTREAAMAAEAAAITEDMIKGKVCYNIVGGGDGMKPKSEMTEAELEYYEDKFWRSSPVRTPENIELIRQWITDGESLQEISRRFKKLGYKTLDKTTVKSICNDNGIEIPNSRDPKVLQFIEDETSKGTPYKEIAKGLTAFGLKRTSTYISEVVKENGFTIKRPRFNPIRKKENLEILKELHSVKGWGCVRICRHFEKMGISVSEPTVTILLKEMGFQTQPQKAGVIREQKNLAIIEYLYKEKGWGCVKVSRYFKTMGIRVCHKTIRNIAKEMGLVKAA